ncbi:MAG TPA: SRPBCC family protein [Nocardioides sp.]|uniref:SRPBCC family protein n=1 Tax=Nocardioides sp. TaxID=35761 RepID=UPI002D80C2C5|nr:SRPBCC family protein [Nocardioides sp.]HET6651922.1 SRPBCC family protein [Nocardioides sp.]
MGMELTHTFTVPATVDATWAHFQDIESVAGCFPGATVTEVSGDDFKGSCKVKLGPIALVYSGTGSFVEKDEAAHRFVVDAKGKDKRGNGTAGATVTATMSDSGGSTDVTVVTDLAITGKPAQFGRGVIQDVSDKLLGQFVACLEQQVGESTAAGAAAATETVEPAGSEIPPEPPESPAAPAPPAAPATAGSASAASAPRSAAPRAEAKEDDALDLGATVVPILAKTYWKQALAGLVVLLFVIRMIRKR